MQSWSRQKATEKSGSFVMMPRLPLPIAEVKKRAPGDRDPLTILAFRTNSSHDDATEAERPGRIDPLAPKHASSPSSEFLRQSMKNSGTNTLPSFTPIQICSRRWLRKPSEPANFWQAMPRSMEVIPIQAFLIRCLCSADRPADAMHRLRREEARRIAASIAFPPPKRSAPYSGRARA